MLLNIFNEVTDDGHEADAGEDVDKNGHDHSGAENAAEAGGYSSEEGVADELPRFFVEFHELHAFELAHFFGECGDLFDEFCFGCCFAWGHTGVFI